jgi:hypothetical protein
VLEHDAALGHRERRDRSLGPRDRVLRRHGCACGLVGCLREEEMMDDASLALSVCLKRLWNGGIRNLEEETLELETAGI